MNARPRVLLLVDTVGGGGGEQVVADLAMRLDPRRFDVAVCATRAEGRLAGAVRAAGVPVTVIGRRSRWDVRGMARLWRYLRRGRFDILHAHKFGSNVWGRLFGHASGIPVVIAHEHTWNYRGGLGGRVRAAIDRALSRRCEAIVTPSDADRRAWARLVGVAPHKLITIKNGVAAPPPPPAALRQELGLPTDALVVGSIGRLEAQKGFDLLLRAFALIADRHPRARLVLIGEGSQRERLAALARDLGVADRFVLAGYRHAAASLAAEFDVYASASRYEGLPLAVLEAMSVGRPIVAAAVGGVPEVVVDGETGFLTPAGDVEAFADRLDRLLADAELRGRMGRRGRERYRTAFTVERMVGDVEALYLDLLRAAPCGRADRAERWAPSA